MGISNTYLLLVVCIKQKTLAKCISSVSLRERKGEEMSQSKNFVYLSAGGLSTELYLGSEGYYNTLVLSIDKMGGPIYSVESFKLSTYSHW